MNETSSLCDFPGTYAFVDVETTGMSAARGRVIEIGILRVEDGREKARYSKLINPQCGFSPWITDLTGIRPEDLVDAPTFDEIAREILEHLEGAVFVAHNARFDYSFLQNEFKRYAMDFDYRMLCSARLSRKLFPEHRHHNLSAIIERHNLTIQARHRAFDDAKAIWDFFQSAHALKGAEAFHGTLSEFLNKKRPAFPIPYQQIDVLPETNGVYCFYGAEGELLLVGKSKNMRSRVLNHFANDSLTKKQIKMCTQVQEIQVIETPGEFSATLLAADLIKKHTPPFNPARRKKDPDVLRSWPYPGAIMIDEFDREQDKGVAYIAKNWLIIGKVEYTGESKSISQETLPFDYDIYKLLLRTTLNPGSARITPLPEAELAEMQA